MTIVVVLLAGAVAVSPVVLPTTARGVGVGLLALSFFTVTWNGIIIAGLQPSDTFLFLAFGVLGVDALARSSSFRLPVAVVGGAGFVAVAGLITHFRPTTATYETYRFVAGNVLSTLGERRYASNNLQQLVKFEIALLVLPAVVALLRPTRREVRLLADCWLASATVNCLLGISDIAGLTSVSQHILGYSDASGRVAGLTAQPNHLAVATVLALPVALTWLVRPRRRVIGGVLLVILLVGVDVSGSRGGLVAAALAMVTTVVFVRRLHRVGRGILLLLPLVVALFLELATSLTATSVGGRTDVAASDAERYNLRTQALKDVLHSPVHGIGFDHLFEAHEVHLQVLAAGGLIAFAGFLLYAVGVARRAPLAMRTDPLLGPALAASLLTWFALQFVENQIADRYLYVPVALLLALAELRRDRPAPSPSPTDRIYRPDPAVLDPSRGCRPVRRLRPQRSHRCETAPAATGRVRDPGSRWSRRLLPRRSLALRDGLAAVGACRQGGRLLLLGRRDPPARKSRSRSALRPYTRNRHR